MRTPLVFHEASPDIVEHPLFVIITLVGEAARIVLKPKAVSAGRKYGGNVMNKLIVLLALLLPGCATVILGTEQDVAVNTHPPGASIQFSNGQSCTSPCRIHTSRSASLVITMVKDGCQTQTATMVPTLSGAGVVLGGLVDYGTGAVYDLQPNPLTVTLACNASGATAAAAQPAAATPAPATVAAAPAQPAPAAPAVAVPSAHWVGQGERDGCGKPYAVDITVKGPAAKGRVDRDGIAYAVNASLDPNGDLDNSLAALADPASAPTAPANLNLKLKFEGQVATGAYSTFNGGAFGCTTALTLQRTGG